MEGHSVSYVVGVLVGVLVVGFLCLFLIKRTRRDRRLRQQYDERQRLIRGRGYGIAFYTVVVAIVLYPFLEEWIDFPVETDVAMYLIVLLGVLVHVVYCIWHDAYVSLMEVRSRVYLLLAVLGLLNLILGIRNVAIGTAFTKGKLNLAGMNLFVGALLLIVFAVLFLRSVIPERGFDTEDEDGEEEEFTDGGDER